MPRSLFVIAALFVFAGRLVSAEPPAHDFARWEAEVAAYEARDAAYPPPKGAVLFIGSSTIRLWRTLAADFPEYAVINRGFGGSQIVDATHFADRLIFPHEPSVICLRSGGNDLNAGKTPEKVFAEFQEFVAVVHARLPSATIVFMELSPAISRWSQAEANRALNGLVAEFAARTPHVRFFEAWSVPLDDAGDARPELFQSDKLHFNAAGYRLLAERIRPQMAAIAAEKDIPRPTLAGALISGQRTLVLGDSITQAGRYVTFLEYYLHRTAPGATPDIISIGLSSETVSGLTEKKHPYARPCVLERLDRALQATKPQVVLACYGMNDGIYHPLSPDRLAAFNSGLDRLIAQVAAIGARLVLVTPPVFDPVPIPDKLAAEGAVEFGYSQFYPGYDDVLAEFARAELRRASPNVAVIDLHTEMVAALEARRRDDRDFTFSRDGVHPGDPGHLLMARILAKGLGLELPAVDLDTELVRIQEDPLYAVVNDRRRMRSEVWLSYVGYSREREIKSASVEASEAVARRLEGEIEAIASGR